MSKKFFFFIFYTRKRETLGDIDYIAVPPTAITFISDVIRYRVAFDPSRFDFSMNENMRTEEVVTGCDDDIVSFIPWPIILQPGRMGNWHVNANEIIHR